MAPLQTYLAHCGACAGLMVLRWESAGWYYVCYTCGAQTEPRETAAEADADVVWVPVTTPTGKAVLDVGARL